MKKLINNKKFFLGFKQTFICLIFMLIFIYYYYTCIGTYNIDDGNYELISVCTINSEELKPLNRSDIGYKNIINDFFNKFTSSNNKVINYKIIEIKQETKTPIPLKHFSEISKKSLILSKIQSDYIRSIELECEFYKNKVSLLETQLLKTKISYQNLTKDINDIIKEMNSFYKKP